MMKPIALLAVALTSLVVFAETSVTNEPARKARRVVRMSAAESAAMKMKLFGGYVRKEGTGKGKILVVNAQRKAGVKKANNNFRMVRQMLKLNVEFADGSLDGMPTKAAVKATGADFVIWIADCESNGDYITLSPDSRWGLVNVAALDDDGPDRKTLDDRVMKMVMRTFALLCGAANSTSGGGVVGPINGYADIDKIVFAGYPIDAYQKTLDYLHGANVDPYVEMTYEMACREGWAPAPTNEFQKAIWDKVHAIPAKPIVIRPETKKVGD